MVAEERVPEPVIRGMRIEFLVAMRVVKLVSRDPRDQPLATTVERDSVSESQPVLEPSRRMEGRMTEISMGSKRDAGACNHVHHHRKTDSWPTRVVSCKN